LSLGFMLDRIILQSSLPAMLTAQVEQNKRKVEIPRPKSRISADVTSLATSARAKPQAVSRRVSAQLATARQRGGRLELTMECVTNLFSSSPRAMDLLRPTARSLLVF
jgi:hypothetical protein